MFNKNPVKVARSKKYGSNFYVCFSLKLSREVNLYSNLEYANFLSVELNPIIVDYLEQPVKVQVENKDGETYQTTFDMEVVYENGIRELWEIKYSNELNENDEKYQRSKKQIEFQKLWCEQNNIKYKVRTEKDILKGPHHLNNMRFMYHSLCLTDPEYFDDNMEIILEKIKKKDCITIGELKKYTNKENIFPLLIHMNIHKYISFDIFNNELCYETEVRYVK
jgi:hypothetical protein